MELTQEKLKEILEYNPDSGIFTWINSPRGGMKSGSKAGRTTYLGYIEIGIEGKYYKAHRLAFLYMTGLFPLLTVDHIDCNRNNNAFSNLRELSDADNKQNVRSPSKRNTTGYLGVSKNGKNRWAAYISIKNKPTYLGIFKSPEEASGAYIKAKREMHEFSTL